MSALFRFAVGLSAFAVVFAALGRFGTTGGSAAIQTATAAAMLAAGTLALWAMVGGADGAFFVSWLLASVLSGASYSVAFVGGGA